MLALVVGSGARLAGLGVAIGLVGAVALTRVMRSLLFDVSPLDPAAFSGSALLLFGVAFFDSGAAPLVWQQSVSYRIAHLPAVAAHKP